jgi:RNAse (barnase) inhibitor barstar
MAEKPTFRIDGASFSDLRGFFDEIESQLLQSEPWGRSLDALDDILRGDVGPLPTEFRLVWEHADLSRRRLGTSGRGSFTELVELIAAHQNVELVLS